MLLTFTEEEMVSFLHDREYKIVEKETERSFSVYHNDVEFYNIKVLVVYKPNGEMVQEPRHISERDTCLKYVFAEELKKALLNMPKSDHETNK